MRIVHVMDHSLPGTDGYSIRAKYLLEAQAAAGHQVTVLTGPTQGPQAIEETVNGVAYRRTHYSTWQAAGVRHGAKHLLFGGAVRKRLSALLDHQGADLVHAHTPFTVARPALAEAQLRNLPFVYEKRNLWEESAKVRGKPTGRWPLFQIAQAIDRSLTSRSDAVCTITEALRQHTAAGGVDASKVFIVGNGVDVQAFVPTSPSAERRASCLRGGDFVIGFIGSFFSFEGLPLLVQAFANLRSSFPNARLVLVGDGEDFSVVQAMVKEKKLEDQVSLTGRIPHHQVMDYYAAMDVLVYPRLRSALTELISPLKPLEPMAMARCVLGSSVGGIRDLISDGQTGVLFEADSQRSLQDKLRAILSRQVDASGLGAAAREAVVAHRQWRHMAEAYEPAYAHALAHKASGK